MPVSMIIDEGINSREKSRIVQNPAGLACLQHLSPDLADHLRAHAGAVSKTLLGKRLRAFQHGIVPMHLAV